MTLEIDILARDFGVKMTTINITENIANAFTSHGEEEYPHECCGFIIGNFKDTGGVRISIKYCTVTTNIIKDYAGGICGQMAGGNNGECKITNCRSSGYIGHGAGGICGGQATSYSSSAPKLKITNCYSTGDIHFGSRKHLMLVPLQF